MRHLSVWCSLGLAWRNPRKRRKGHRLRCTAMSRSVRLAICLSSASLGLTLGAGQRSEILLFMTREALAKFEASNGYNLGVDAEVAVMSKGAGSEYDSENLRKPIIGFVFGEKGLIGDVSLKGSKIKKIDRSS